jgi:hypothetical protein
VDRRTLLEAASRAFLTTVFNRPLSTKLGTGSACSILLKVRKESDRPQKSTSVPHITRLIPGVCLALPGGCGSVGDAIADTAAERSAADGCPAGRDTCPGGGPDPIYNFMVCFHGLLVLYSFSICSLTFLSKDYTYDTCMNSFTPGQSSAMAIYWATYRNTGNVPAPASAPVASPIPAAPVKPPVSAPIPVPVSAPVGKMMMALPLPPPTLPPVVLPGTMMMMTMRSQ